MNFILTFRNIFCSLAHFLFPCTLFVPFRTFKQNVSTPRTTTTTKLLLGPLSRARVQKNEIHTRWIKASETNKFLTPCCWREIIKFWWVFLSIFCSPFVHYFRGSFKRGNNWKLPSLSTSDFEGFCIWFVHRSNNALDRSFRWRIVKNHQENRAQSLGKREKLLSLLTWLIKKTF